MTFIYNDVQQARLLSIVLRGGSKRFYQFVFVPLAAVTIKMDMTMANFYSGTFIANMATLMQVCVCVHVNVGVCVM